VGPKGGTLSADTRYADGRALGSGAPDYRDIKVHGPIVAPLVVFLPQETSTDFWLLDLVARTTRPLTSISDQGRLNMFDVTPDDKHIVFDRTRENADIVLIEIQE
jgi:hypothetical protein